MKSTYYLLLAISMCCFYSTRAQMADVATTAPIDPFSKNPDNLGALANSINLFTGDLNLPLNLVSIPGPGGLGINVTINYSSANIENVVDVWNLESPTGILGLGWSMTFPVIIVDNKQTGARDDDDFFISEGGASFKLTCVGSNNGVKFYKTKNYTNWLISYQSSAEKWEITKDDGTRYIYGDNASGRNTVQWIIQWGNWIGDSNQSSSTRQGIIWNLSEVKTVWGDRVHYTYLNDENSVGGGSLMQTEASYLQKINDQWGNEVELFYKNKLVEEYQEPHTELAEPDAYQERYEKRFLDKIQAKKNATVYQQVFFGYATNLLGSGNTTKRLLKSIVSMTSSGLQLPSLEFGYLTSGVMKGALNQFKSGLGGTVTYNYSSGIQIGHSTRDLLISAPSGYAEPSVMIQDDYVIVTWRIYNGLGHNSNDALAKDIIVKAYSWSGEWKEADLGTINNVKLLDAGTVEQDLLIAGSKDFFAILRPIYNSTSYNLFIWKRSETVPGKWIADNAKVIDLGTHNTDKEQLFCGNKFIAVSNNNGKIFRYTFDANGNTWTENSVTETTATHFTTAANNYIISQNTSPNPDAITFYYLDEVGNWQSKSITNTFNNGSSDSYWYASNSFAFVMANGGNELAYNWDDSYTTFQKTDLGFAYSDNSKVLLTNESQICAIAPVVSNPPTHFRAFRYNGSSWVTSGEKTVVTIGDLSMGPDCLLWQEINQSAQSHFKTFNPNSNTWNTDIDYSYGSQQWFNGLNPIEIGQGYYVNTPNLYFHQPTGDWTYVDHIDFTPYGNGDLTDTWSFRSGNKFLAYVSEVGQLHDLRSQVQYFKNGQRGTYISPYTSGISGIHLARNSESSPLLKELHGYSTIILTSNPFDFANATSIKLLRSINDNVFDKINDYPVVSITTNDGYKDRITSISYASSTALYGQSGGQYNEVTVTPPGSNGYSKSYYFNGLSEVELGTFPDRADISSSQKAKNNYGALVGAMYRQKAFDSGSNMVSESTSAYNVSINAVYLSEFNRYYIPVTALLYKTSIISDQIERVTELNYNLINQVNRKFVYVNGSVQSAQYGEDYRYVWEKYQEAKNLNILAPIVQKLVRDPNHAFTNWYSESASTRWSLWPCSGCYGSSNNVTGPNSIPAPYDSYVYTGAVFTGPNFDGDMGAWIVASQTPGSDWVQSNLVSNRDNSTGIEVESKARGNKSSSIILDATKRPMAVISNSNLAEVAFTSFEDAASGTWNISDGTNTIGTSKTGDQYHLLGTAGISKTGLQSSKEYKLSFWAQSAGGTILINGISQTVNSTGIWTLVEKIISNSTSVTIGRSGSTSIQIDELRIHPLNADMATTTYHQIYGISSQTNSNNQSVYYSYDELGNVKNILDETGSIVKSNQYNFKKQ